MYDTAHTSHTYISHDMPCPRCGHALHQYLACSDDCACEPVRLPGMRELVAA